MMKQITVNILDSDYPAVLQFLETLDAVEIVVNPTDTTLVVSKENTSKKVKTGIDTTPFDRDELRKKHRLSFENISKLRDLFRGAPFDEMEKCLTK
jgi:hypothetical protein